MVGPERPGRIRGYGMRPTPSQLDRGKQIASGNYEEEIKSLKQIAIEQNDRIKILEQALSAGCHTSYSSQWSMYLTLFSFSNILLLNLSYFLFYFYVTAYGCRKHP